MIKQGVFQKSEFSRRSGRKSVHGSLILALFALSACAKLDLMTTRFSDGVEEEETLSAIVPDASGPISVPTSAIAPPTQVVVTAANPVVPPGQCSQVQLNVTNANIAALGASENGQGVAVQVSAVGSVGVFNSSNCAGPSVTLVSVSGAGPVSLYVKNAGDPGVAGPLSVADIKAEVVNVAAPAAVQAVPIEQQDSI